MKPILITTPRTGSELISRMLGNMAVQRFGYKNVLGEFFTISPLFEERFAKNDNSVVVHTFSQRVGSKWFDSAREEQLKRLSLLDNDYAYMFKVFPHLLEDETKKFIVNNYDMVYLERRDKIRQLISFYTLLQYNVAHYSPTSDNKIDSVVYNENSTNLFLRILEVYAQFKKENPSTYPTIFYEDFVEHGANEDYLIDRLGLSNTDFNRLELPFKKTPYIDDPESLISNKDEWNSVKQSIIDRINKIYG